MGSIVFQAPSGGQTNLTGSDGSVTTVITVPAVNATLALADPTNQALMLSYGTTAQRPSSPIPFELRGNTTTGLPEWYDSTTSTWVSFTPTTPPTTTYTANYLLVAAGGGGGSSEGGGGGAGGLFASSLTLTTGSVYTVTIGAGGAGSASSSAAGANGGNSSLVGYAITIGGGGGGSGSGSNNGVSGGSGGGGSNGFAGGSGTSGQGNAGGTGAGSGNYYGGGGGGASAAVSVCTEPGVEQRCHHESLRRGGTVSPISYPPLPHMVPVQEGPVIVDYRVGLVTQVQAGGPQRFGRLASAFLVGFKGVLIRYFAGLWPRE